MFLVILGGSLDVLLDIVVGVCFLVTVVEQQVVCVRAWVVRGDYACEDAVSGKLLACFGVDEGIACCAETVVVVISIIGSLSCPCFERDRCLTDSCRTFSEHGWFGDARDHMIFVTVRVWFGCFWIEKIRRSCPAAPPCVAGPWSFAGR